MNSFMLGFYVINFKWLVGIGFGMSCLLIVDTAVYKVSGIFDPKRMHQSARFNN